MPGFFASLKNNGARLNALAAAVVALGVALTVLLVAATGINPFAGVGLFTGATTPTVSTYDPAVVSVSAPGSVRAGKKANVSVTVGNLGNTAAQVRVTVSGNGGTGSSTTVTVPAGGQVVTTLAWQAPTTRATYTVNSAVALVSTTIVDANLANNSRSVTVKVT